VDLGSFYKGSGWIEPGFCKMIRCLLSLKIDIFHEDVNDEVCEKVLSVNEYAVS